jgi:hypothetical protein
LWNLAWFLKTGLEEMEGDTRLQNLKARDAKSVGRSSDRFSLLNNHNGEHLHRLSSGIMRVMHGAAWYYGSITS